MKKMFRVCFFVLLAVMLYAGLSVNAADADVPEEFTAEETQLLTEAVEPLTEALGEYYFINSIHFQPISHDPVFPSENRIYANVTYNMVLLAEELSDLPYFEGICKYVGVDSIADLTQADIDAVLQAGDAPICAEASALAQQNVSAQTVYDALETLKSQYDEYIGLSSDCVYTVCVTLDEAGEIADVCAMTETRFVPLSDFFPQSSAQMQSDGVASLNTCMEEIAEEPDAEICAAPPLYYRVAARDYANTYTSEAAYSSTCPHGNHCIDLSKYNKGFTLYCHNDTVSRRYSAHNNDHCKKAYTEGYWGSDTVEFYVFLTSTTAAVPGGDTQ